MAAACAAAALVAIAFYALLWKNAPFRDTDTTEYLKAAQAIATGHFETFQPRTPGFPIFTLLVGTGRMFFLVSLALHMASVGMMVAVLRSMRVNWRLTALFAAVAVLPPFVQKDAYLLTEGLFEFLTTAAFAALWAGLRSRTFMALSGVAFALSAITRPQAQLLPFVMAALLAFYFGRREGLKRAAFLLAPFCLLLGAVMANNLVRFHDFNLTYDLGFHLGTRVYPIFEDVPDPQLRSVLIATRDAAYTDPDKNPIWSSLYSRPELMEVKGMTAPQLAHYEQKVFLRLILSHPLAWLEQAGQAVIRFWLPDLSKRTNQGSVLRVVSMATQLGLSIAFLTLAVLWAGLALGRLLLPVAAWLPNPSYRFLFTAAMATVFYTMTICCGLDMGQPRYRAPVELIILLAVAMAADFLLKQRALNRSGR